MVKITYKGNSLNPLNDPAYIFQKDNSEYGYFGRASQRTQELAQQISKLSDSYKNGRQIKNSSSRRLTQLSPDC